LACSHRLLPISTHEVRGSLGGARVILLVRWLER
jgi:hypothetical protein